MRKVAVAMSGGIDSSVAALLLKDQGYEILGITMKLWHDNNQEVDDARSVAIQLGIPHQVIDLKPQFINRVVDYFCREYLSGRTPNPCVICNYYIKFGLLLEKAMELGAEFLATGHYARVVRESDGRMALLAALHPRKDQSYVLYRLTQAQLKRVILPLGHYSKDEVIQLARQHQLAVSGKTESQEICFVSSMNYGDFIEKFAAVEHLQGEFKLSNGKSLGPHRGIHRYTIGQRKGLGLALGFPAYVTGIDAKTNTVWVGSNESLYHKALIAEDFTFISGEVPDDSIKALAKIRYLAPKVEAVATPISESEVKISFKAPQRAITPGQSVVLYDGEKVLGGGIIARYF